MSDESDESSNEIPLDRRSRDKRAPEIYSKSDDEVDKRSTQSRRDGVSIGRNPLSQSMRENKTSYLALEEIQKKKSPLSQSMVEDQPRGPYCKMKQWNSMDSGESDMECSRKNMPFAGSIKRKLRRKPTKRFDKVEDSYGNDTEQYEQIRQRVLKERAVVNAIEALQERWRMIMFMYNDCIELNEGRKDREHRKLTVKRQLELMFIISVFFVMCIPITVIMVIICR